MLTFSETKGPFDTFWYDQYTGLKKGLNQGPLSWHIIFKYKLILKSYLKEYQ